MTNNHAIKLVAWRAPTKTEGPPLYKYVIVGIIVSDEPIEGIDDKTCTVLEAQGVHSLELHDALSAMAKREAKQPGRSANDYLREMGYQ